MVKLSFKRKVELYLWTQNKQNYNRFSFCIDKERENLKAVLLTDMDVSIRMICNLKRVGKVLLNGNVAKMYQKVSIGDIVTLELSEEVNDYISQYVDLDIVYEDVDLLVVNKNSNIVVHPTKSHQEDTLLNYVKAYFEKSNIKSKVRFVNRLDKDTTGLVVIAKNQYAHSILTKENSMWDMEKIYIAIVSGFLPEKSKTINLPLGKAEEGDIRRHVFDGGQEAITHYTVLKELNNTAVGDYSMIEVKLETGRTHQIRAHFEHLGHPLLGDELYGGNMQLIQRQALHCIRLSFETPRCGKITLEAPLPQDIIQLISDSEPSSKGI